MTRVIYSTAATINGMIADEEGSLAWLYDADRSGDLDISELIPDVGCVVEGSTAYLRTLEETPPDPARPTWSSQYRDRPTFVFTTRDLPVQEGTDVHFVRGTVEDALPAILEAAGDGNVWIVGGGELAGHFIDAGALDEIQISFGPSLLAKGAPVLPRSVDAQRLTLTGMAQHGVYATLTYSVST
jgi:dihydrofolate reductase